MQTLICGSLAYDTIMVFQDSFKNHILPDQIHKLSVAFYVPEMRREFGGTAGNIAYNLQLLEGKPLMMATVGEDFASYTNWLNKNNLITTHIKTIANSFTAQAFITTDIDDNQITAFHPGAMVESHQNSVNDAKNVSLAIIAPDGRDGMFAHAKECFDANIPFLFDPGQGLPMFNGDELLHFIEMATYLAVNRCFRSACVRGCSARRRQSRRRRCTAKPALDRLAHRLQTPSQRPVQCTAPAKYSAAFCVQYRKSRDHPSARFCL